MRQKLLAVALAFLAAPSVLGWNATGHEAVAAIAWDNMTAHAQDRAIATLMQAPKNACLLDLFPNDHRPLKARQREFFIRVATWADLVRPTKDKITGAPDTRPCTQYHHAEWHFFDHFWSGTSGASGMTAPMTRTDIPPATTNAVERLEHFKPLVACKTAPCVDAPDQQALDLAWIIHLVGDIHQPLHNAARVTTVAGEEQGDRGGNLFALDKDHGPPVLHSFWDGIVSDVIPRPKGEKEIPYIDHVIARIEHDHPRSSVTTLKPGDFNAWSEEGVATAERIAYPASLQRGKVPGGSYRQTVFKAADEAVATAGYRLADLLSSILD